MAVREETFERAEREDGDSWRSLGLFEGMPAQRQVLPRSGISYRACTGGGRSPLLLVSGTEFDRELLRIERVAEGAATVIFPNTARGTLEGAFENSSLRSAVLNEGLERLGGCEDEDDNSHDGIFRNAEIRQVTLPSTLRVLGDCAFDRCRELSRVAIREDSALERIGAHSFSESVVEKITIPRTTKAVSANAFEKCENLKIV